MARQIFLKIFMCVTYNYPRKVYGHLKTKAKSEEKGMGISDLFTTSKIFQK
jgi:hypothetical protein